MDLYRQEILDHYKHPHHFGHLAHADTTKTLFNTSCGDTITIELLFTEDHGTRMVKDIMFSGEGCAVSMASASLLTDLVKGKSVEDIRALTREDIMRFFGQEVLTPSRVKCALLPLEVLHQCVGDDA